MSNTEIAVLVISSGLAAGLFSGVVTLLGGMWERKHRTKEREAVALHEARLRREAAHDAARPEFLPKAEALSTWMHQTAGRIHWDEVGSNWWAGTRGAVPSREEVIPLLRTIRYGHPTKAVRDKANGLLTDLEHRFTEIVGNEIPDPTFDEVIDWLSRTEELIELVHTPDPANA
ncbi:hypothetical protein [Janibacter melonis]|uniref:hypothetical protein n=1 Tax=Janibacter melonis TaxID=262209 RepID=UPI0019198366|nr:hypothetical protein [Janibacter melonis]